MRDPDSRPTGTTPLPGPMFVVPNGPDTELVGERPSRKVIDLGARMIGRVLADRYRIERLISQGAMGRVFLATQLRLDRPAAVKVMNQAGDPRFAMRFCREASIASQLAHPNIVSVYDYGETDRGELFMAMEYCAGRPLHEVLFTEGPFAPDRAVNIAIQLARALRKAHAQALVHRDLKPANIILTPDDDGTDFVKVLDFGLVKLFAPEESELAAPFREDHLTRPGNMVGTPEYCSPEQALGDPIDGRADIYSLGVLLFQMLSGKLPFTGKSLIETVTHHFRSPIPSIASVAPDVECPEDIERIIHRCMAKSRDDRYASTDELLADLKIVWRTLTDESYGTEISVPALRDSLLPREVPEEVDEIALPPDPSEVRGGFDVATTVDDPSVQTMRMLRWTAFALFLIALASGAYWVGATWGAAQPEPVPAVLVPIVLPAPAGLSLPQIAEPEKTIEPIATEEPRKVKRERKASRRKPARTFKENPY